MNPLLQHAKVYTLGKRGQTAHFKVSKASLEKQGIDIHTVGRGGETTFHGPGQIVLYPVVNLRRLGLGARAYVETLEDCMVAACGHYGIQARVSVLTSAAMVHADALQKTVVCATEHPGSCAGQDRCLGR